MGVSFVIVKCFVFVLNLICLVLGLAGISVNAYGLQNACPGTEEHTYFVVGIITSSLICMTTLFGCYGVVCELLGMNIIYSIFIVMLLAVQYLQMQTLEPNTFYLSAVKCRDIFQFNCCGESIPLSCNRHNETVEPINLHKDGCLLALKNFYKSAVERDHLLNWALVIAECFACINAFVLSSLLYRQNRVQRPCARPSHEDVRVQVGPLGNHVGSRSHLLSD